MTRHLFDDIYYVGACDKCKPLFENLFPLPDGMRYNSYLIKDEKTALMDTADETVREEFLANVENALSGGKLDYLVIHHAEPDHTALFTEVLNLHSETVLVTSAMGLKFINQFTGKDYTARTKVVKEGDCLSLGKHSLTFYCAPMVHWPEVLVSYDNYCKTLFSADAFGAFGSEQGGITVSSLADTDLWANEARRYYSNIVGKFGSNVATLLKKASALQIDKICPLHGMVFDTDCDFALKKYTAWSNYDAEVNSTLIVYGSMYGNTKRAADLLACALDKNGETVKVLDVSKTHYSYIIADCFKYSKLVFAAPTYYGGVFPAMEQLLNVLKKTNMTSRKIAFIENGTWAALAGKAMKETLSTLKADFSSPTVSIKSAVTKETEQQIIALAATLTDN